MNVHCIKTGAFSLGLALAVCFCPLMARAGMLSLEEQTLAESLANASIWQQQRSANRLHGELQNQPQDPKPETAAHPLNIQTLSVEVDEKKKKSLTRRARVYQFNYLTQQARVAIVDLSDRTVQKIQTINSVHLPLNEVEINTARSLTEQSLQIMQAMNKEQARRGLPVLNDLSAIDVKASIFEPLDKAHACAQQRCALISLFDKTRTVFAVEPLVNLQLLSVDILQQN